MKTTKATLEFFLGHVPGHGNNDVMFLVRRVRGGLYRITGDDGIDTFGIVQKRERSDWYAEIAIGDEHVNACGDTLAEVIDYLADHWSSRRHHRRGRGKADSAGWAQRLRARIANL